MMRPRPPLRELPAPGDGWPAELVDRYRDQRTTLVQIATLMLGSRAEAEEVVQDAFVSVARRWSAVRQPDAYLRRAVVNGATGVLRRRTTAHTHRPDPPPPEAPSQLVEFRDVLLTLPDRQRTVLVLRYVDDRSDDEIADILGCRRATVRSLAARGLAAIRKELT